MLAPAHSTHRGLPSGRFYGEPKKPEQEQKREAWQRQLKALEQDMAQRMSPQPLRSRLDPESTSEGADVTCKGATLHIEGVDFRQPGKGLPAFADWLSKYASSELRWDFEAINDDAEAEDVR